jgi:hypothetical protein
MKKQKQTSKDETLALANTIVELKSTQYIFSFLECNST